MVFVQPAAPLVKQWQFTAAEKTQIEDAFVQNTSQTLFHTSRTADVSKGHSPLLYLYFLHSPLLQNQQ